MFLGAARYTWQKEIHHDQIKLHLWNQLQLRDLLLHRLHLQ